MLTINLAAVQENWIALSSIANQAAISSVIKANAYGLGASQVGNSLYEVGCKEFFVASLEEGIEARSFLPGDAIIYVLGGARLGKEKTFIEANLIPVLCSMAALHRWVDINQSLGSHAPSAIKINTGMTRLGLDVEEIKGLVNNTQLLKKCNPVLVMSHLACADEPLHPLNVSQHESFSECVQWLRGVLPDTRFSLANSSGIFLGPHYHFDLVRPGAALYGIAPQPDIPNPMKPVVHLELPIIQIRTLSHGASIGYGAEFVLPEGARIAVVAGGYADGVNRTLGKNPEGFLCGYPVHSVGRVSMDATMFDISHVPIPDEQLLQASIEVINEKITVDYLSKKNNSLGYEVLTGLGRRYKREYIPGHKNE